MLAVAILLIHLVVITFNIFGCVVVPLGAWRHWGWVREFWWRAVHLGAWVVVALQAVLGRACFLTIWQADAQGGVSHVQPLIESWIDRVVFWPFPIWVFAIAYVVLFLYVVALWIFVRPRPPWRAARV